MPAVGIRGFSGVIPRLSFDMLQPNQARLAYNCWLTSGELRPLQEPLLVNEPANVAGVIQSLYHLHVPASAQAAWLVWTKDVDVVRSPLSGDKSGRVYYTGDGEPRVTNYALATSGAEPFPTSFYVHGVAAPTIAPTVGAPSGGAGSTENRAYLMTFVAKTGGIEEQSAPSPASSVVAGKVDDTWPLTGLQTAPPNSLGVSAASWAGGVATYTVASTFGFRAGEEVSITGVTPAEYNVRGPITTLGATTLSVAVAADPGAYVGGGTASRVAPHNTTGMTKRLYRSVTGSSPDSDVFLLVAELPVGDTTYNDSVAPENLGEELPSRGWLMPPVDLKAIISLPSGVFAGISGNIVCFSEPYQVHAWPLKYQRPMDYDGVALGQFGTTVVAATTGTPYLLTGTDPGTMTMQQVEEVYPCVSKRGMVSMGFGVLYPTVEGLALVGVSGADLATKDFYTEKEWNSQLTPSAFVGERYAGYYFAAFSHQGTDQLFMMNRREAAAVTFATLRATALHMDLQDDVLYVVIDNKIHAWNKANTTMTMDWMSGDVVLPKPANFGAAKVDGEFSTSAAEQAERQAVNVAILAANNAIIAALGTDGAMNTSMVNQYSLNGSVLRPFISVSPDGITFTLYSQGKLVFATEVVNNAVFRLPSGYKSDRYTVRLSGSITVKSVQLGDTPASLAVV